MPMKHCSHTGVVAWLTGVLAAMFVCGQLAAQTPGAQTAVNRLSVDSNDLMVGLNGYIQPGQWASLRVDITNPAPRPLPVICQWEMADVDGELVTYEREYTLNESRRERVWLYGALTPSTDHNTHWRLRVLDAETRDILVSLNVKVPLTSITAREVRLVGITGGVGMGLSAYAVPVDERIGAWTQQEGTQFISSIDPANLPDRWQGLDAMSALIWTPNGGDPGGKLSLPAIEALREWVRRGGHLVVILPSVGDLWTGSPLGDMLPIESTTTLSDQMPPAFVGPIPSTDLRLDLKRLQPRKGAVVLESDTDANPLIVAGRYGFGCVTVIGVDLTDRQLVRANLPSGTWPVWNTIFGWQGPAFRDAAVDMYVNKTRTMPRPSLRTHQDLDANWIPETIAMQGTASAPLLLAILLFCIYWITAGPASFLVLKVKKRTRFAWQVFVAIVAFFTLVSWGGAYLLRPVEASLEHFTFLDIAADTGLVRGRSWSTVLVPIHGEVEVALDPENVSNNRNLIAAQGITSQGSDSAYPDSITYRVSSTSPNQALVPFRSTAKQFSMAYLGTRAGGVGEPAWTAPLGQLKIVDAWPSGTLINDMPVTLTSVRVVFNRGDGRQWIWDVAEQWQPGERLPFDATSPRRSAKELAIRSGEFEKPWSGYLGELARKPEVGGRQRMINFTTMLTLFDRLPPPKFMYEEGGTMVSYLGSQSYDLHRTFARQVDMSMQISMPSLLVIAYADDSPLPLPLTVDGDTLPSRGTTVVRIYYPLD